jgi:positive regulator of sigma E activity
MTRYFYLVGSVLALIASGAALWLSGHDRIIRFAAMFGVTTSVLLARMYQKAKIQDMKQTS